MRHGYWLWGFLATTVTSGMVLAQGKPVSIEKERAAIEEAALNYLEGWFAGDAERMSRALHPELTKRGFQPSPATGGHFVNHLTASNMVELTRAGVGKKTPRATNKTAVMILDVYRDIASVKTVCSEFIDYLQLVKIDGQWKIINVLWEPTEEAEHRRREQAQEQTENHKKEE